MNAVFPMSGPLTMSSLEIAELTGKRHDHVMRDIKNVLIELHGEGGLPNFGDTHQNPQNGQRYPIFRLPRRECMVLVTGYSITLRAKVVDRLDELERAARDPAFLLNQALNDPGQAAALLLQQVEKVQELQLTVEAQSEEISMLAPKGHALDRIAKADGSMCITDAAKHLQERPKDMFARLQAWGWIYKRAGAAHYVGYQTKIAAGLLEHKVKIVPRDDGSEKVTEQVRVTPKGLAKLAELLRPDDDAPLLPMGAPG